MVAACDGGAVQAPAYQGTTYTLPATPGGRMCADQCKKAREYCAQSCDLDYRACYNDVQADAQKSYDLYVRERFMNHASVDLLPSDFEHADLCNAEKKRCLADCDTPYNACYKSCGGGITVTTTCQFMCFE